MSAQSIQVMMNPNSAHWTRRKFAKSLGIAGGLAIWKTHGAESGSVPKVAVIGHTGRGDFGHGLDTMWLKLPEFELAAVADPSSAGLEKALGRLGLDRGFREYRAMLAEVRPDIVAVGMRHIDQHRDAALAAIDAGARGIYIEKPFCRTPAEADEIVEACRRGNVKLAVAHRNRYHPVLPVLRALIHDGLVGRLLEIRARGKEDARGGALDLWVLGSHLLNLIHYFAGDPVACSASVIQDGRPASAGDVREGGEGVGRLAGNGVHARFEMASGIPAFFDSIQHAGDRAVGFGIQLVGTEGIVDLRADQEPLAHLMAGNPFHPRDGARRWVPITTAGVGRPEPIDNLRAQVMGHLTGARDLLAAMREDRDPLCSARDARVTIEMINAVFESHRLKGQRVGFPLQQRRNAFELETQAQKPTQ